MFRYSIGALLLLASCAAFPYPMYESAVREPGSYDLLYSTTKGALNETWHFTAPVNVTSFIFPTQVFDIWSSDPWENGTYTESIELLVYETKLASSAAKFETKLVGGGSYSGSVNFGQELRIPVRDAMPGAQSLAVKTYTSGSVGYRYQVSIGFKTAGLYPWYTTRVLSDYSCVNAVTNSGGIAIGLAFNRD